MIRLINPASALFTCHQILTLTSLLPFPQPSALVCQDPNKSTNKSCQQTPPGRATAIAESWCQAKPRGCPPAHCHLPCLSDRSAMGSHWPQQRIGPQHLLSNIVGPCVFFITQAHPPLRLNEGSQAGPKRTRVCELMGLWGSCPENCVPTPVTFSAPAIPGAFPGSSCPSVPSLQSHTPYFLQGTLWPAGGEDHTSRNSPRRTGVRSAQGSMRLLVKSLSRILQQQEDVTVPSSCGLSLRHICTNGL